MPGARATVEPLSAGESLGYSASDEGSQLELRLQRQLEEDVARIFNESIHSDLQLLYGELKIPTHSCILKARANKFYQEIKTILQVNNGHRRESFDEIYSFISDVYTECNIQHREKEIIAYINQNLNESANCISPEEKSRQKTLSSSPSTELTKEYYALVPIDGNILDKELIEQDALSNAFQTISKSQIEDINEKQNQQCTKPTSLFLNSSQISKISKHSNTCDILRESDSQSINVLKKVNDIDEKKVHSNYKVCKTLKEKDKFKDILLVNSSLPDTSIDKVLDPTYSPDSLISNEPSSSSDYLSAAYAVSPGAVFSSALSHINVGKNAAKMESTITFSDSGFETTGMLESLNSHNDVTLTDVSLTESTFHDTINDDANCHDPTSSNVDKNHIQKLKRSTSLHSPTGGTSTGKDLKDCKSNKPSLTEMSGTSTKEEKQRQNEEIVILESSSLSSETGSWESVFPPKLPDKDVCIKFISSERQNALEAQGICKLQHITSNIEYETHDDLCPSLVQKSPFRSTSCFIDAASLVDGSEDALTVHTESNKDKVFMSSDNNILPDSSRAVPFMVKRDLSPNDWSGSNDNEDSLEQAENKDPDSIQKDLSLEIFDMTPITEDSLCSNTFNTPVGSSHCNSKVTPITNKDAKKCDSAWEVQINPSFSTPNNSIISVGTQNFEFNVYESAEGESEISIVSKAPNHLNRYVDILSQTTLNETSTEVQKNYNSYDTVLQKNSYVDIYSQSTPNEASTEIQKNVSKNNDVVIISGGMSVEDYLPQLDSHSGSPLMKKRIENIPIVSGAHIPEPEDIPEKTPKTPSSASFWVVDMSTSHKSDISECSTKSNHKPLDKAVVFLRSGSKSTCGNDTCRSRSLVDSDASEKSTHKFYIDLSTLPDASAPEQKQEGDDTNEKKNIFSMFIDLGDKSTAVKEMPARLSSSLNTKKSCKSETKCTSKSLMTPKRLSNHEDNILFEKLESLCDDPNISISELIKLPKNLKENRNESSNHTLKATSEIITKIIEEEPTREDKLDLFVKLSDLDKPMSKAEHVIAPVKKERPIRMSISEYDYEKVSQLIDLSTNERISSFHSENARSLNRLFPHLKNDFSRSMPENLSSRTRPPLGVGVSSSTGDVDDQASDMSEMSSVQSSYCRSVVENSTTEETEQTSSLISNCQSRLGQDLLRMFLEEIAPDVIVQASGRRIKAHKCILSSRCQYFAGILSGDYVQSAGNVISLPSFSFGVVHFALCHIYSGVSTIPDSISILEVATLADVLGLEGLKEAIMFKIRAKYCHHFHTPCPVCIAGVLECFPLSSAYGLDDLYRKSLRWITKHFSKVWPTKAFATLPLALLEKCYQEHIVNLTPETVLETVYGCGITVASLQSGRWTEMVLCLCQRLVNAAARFTARRLSAVMRASAALPAEVAPSPAQALDECLAYAIQWAPPDEACRAYAFLSALVRDLHAQPDLISGKAADPGSLLHRCAPWWRQQCEGALVQAAPRVAGTQAFKELPEDLRKRLRELGCFVFDAPTLQPQRKTKTPRSKPAWKPSALDIEKVRVCFVPYSPKPQPLAGFDSVDLTAHKKQNRSHPPNVKMTKVQQERAKYNQIKANQSQERLNCKASTSRNAYENAKPRFLEPRAVKEGMKKPQPKLVSSSESSRISSPIQARRARASRLEARMVAAGPSRPTLTPGPSRPTLPPGSSRPTLPPGDPSTDSLTESQTSNKYATYTKTKHTSKESLKSVAQPAAKCQQTTSAVNKSKASKIPVYLHSKSCNAVGVSSRETRQRLQGGKMTASSLSSLSQARNMANERKVSGSLMNATKSSQAKMVAKLVKETAIKDAAKHGKQPKCSKQTTPQSPSDIPVMERSGTFLKDDPMFGDKTCDIDE